MLQHGQEQIECLMQGAGSHLQLISSLLREIEIKPVLDSDYPRVVVELLAPTILHQSYTHLIFHLMVHHGELLEPSTQAGK